MDERERLTGILKGFISPIVERLGFELYDLNYIQSRKRIIVRVIIDNPSGLVSVDDCAKVSSRISAALDLEDLDIFEGRYYLEVSSPGIERRLRNIDDCKRFVGSLVSYKVRDGNRRMGIIRDVEDGECIIEVEGDKENIQFDDFEYIHIKMDLDRELRKK
ncbi:MAG: ribosome maturation factor RimP [bacterium]